MPVGFRLQTAPSISGNTKGSCSVKTRLFMFCAEDQAAGEVGGRYGVTKRVMMKIMDLCYEKHRKKRLFKPTAALR